MSANYASGQILTASELNSSLDGKADLDPSTGKLALSEVPIQVLADIVSAHNLATTAETDAQTGIAHAGTAQARADGAYTLATTAETDAQSAHTLAQTAETDAQTGISHAGTAQARADSAYTLATTAEADAQTGISHASTAQARANSAYTLATTAESDGQIAISGLASKANLVSGKVPLSQLPYSAGHNITIDSSGIIASSGGSSSGLPVLTKPLVADFPFQIALHQSEDGNHITTVVDSDYGILFSPSPSYSSNQTKGIFKTLDFSQPFTLTAHTETLSVDYPIMTIGIGFRDSISGKTTAITRGPFPAQGGTCLNSIIGLNWNGDNTTCNTDVSSAPIFLYHWNKPDVWWQAISDGTNVRILISTDGIHFTQFFVFGIHYLAPYNQIGITSSDVQIGDLNSTPSHNAVLHKIDSWLITTP